MTPLDQTTWAEAQAKSPENKSNLKIKLTTAAAVVALTTSTQAQSLLDKCLDYDSDINNNWTVSKFEKTICNKKLSAAWLTWEWKRLKEEWQRLDKKIEDSKKRLWEVLAQN